MKKTLLSVVVALAAIAMHAQITPTQVVSPDGKLTVNLFCPDEGTPTYSVQYNGKVAIAESQLGLITNEANLATGLTAAEIQTSHIDKSYTLSRSKVSQVHYEANSIVWKLRNTQGVNVLDIEFRVSNNDVAMRYLMPKTGETGSVRVLSEETRFTLPDGTTTFLTPQSDAMIGWKRTKPSYEELYTYDAPMGMASQYDHGYTFPCLFNVNPDKADQHLWVLISETGVDSRYCASRLSDAHYSPLDKYRSIFQTSGPNTYKVSYPMPEENNGFGSAEPAVALPGATPWRTITIGESLKPIAETTAPWDNVEPRYESRHEYKPGRGTWSWILWQDWSINYEDQCKYVDLANAMGYEYVLVDNWWDTNIGKDRIVDLIKYANSKNVDVILWYSSSGNWNDIVQGPVNKMSSAVERKREMQWLQKVGVKGIKVDFFGGDKQETMRLYEEILSDADDNGLFVIFHGCTIPRGWERMYPNYVGSEAVLASENLIFDQRFCDLEAKHACLHPVIRNTIGCMEWGGSFQNKVMNRENRQPAKGHSPQRLTTSTFSLATAVLFQNPAQNYALAPNNLEDAPEVSMDFMRQVPTTWDEVRFIDGYPGKYMCLARRHGDKWYVAAVAAEDTEITIDMSQFASAETMISGGDSPVAKPVKKDRKGCVKVKLNANDGIVIY